MMYVVLVSSLMGPICSLSEESWYVIAAPSSHVMERCDRPWVHFHAPGLNTLIYPSPSYIFSGGLGCSCLELEADLEVVHNSWFLTCLASPSAQWFKGISRSRVHTIKSLAWLFESWDPPPLTIPVFHSHSCRFHGSLTNDHEV